jgi:hypothetical protein
VARFVITNLIFQGGNVDEQQTQPVDGNEEETQVPAEGGEEQPAEGGAPVEGGDETEDDEEEAPAEGGEEAQA